jgi:hypothetical protein
MALRESAAMKRAGNSWAAKFEPDPGQPFQIAAKCLIDLIQQ